MAKIIDPLSDNNFDPLGSKKFMKITHWFSVLNDSFPLLT